MHGYMHIQTVVTIYFTRSHTHACTLRQCSMPVGVTDRDILQYMMVKKVEGTETIVVVFKDAKHPKVPEKKGFIRFETKN